jgi:poly-gamma-glutamate capsule biosynthesis protein CapA/YwtB (metallophosphatase superfamily)
MTISRSETHQQDKLKRQRKRRRMIRIQFWLLVMIVVAGGGLLVLTQTDFLTGWTGSKQEHKPGVVSQKPDDAGAKSNSGITGESDKQPDGIDGAEQTAVVAGGDANSPGSSEGGAANGDSPNEDGAAANNGQSGEGSAGSGSDAETVELSFVGDILINEYVSSVTELEGYDYLFQKALFHLSEPDLTAGNLEYPVTTRGVPVKGTKYVFKGSPETLPAIKGAGFDVLSLANNHALDQGIEGLRDTMQHLDDAGLAYVGAGNNDTEAFAPVVKEVKGIKVAYVGVSKVIPFVEWKADKNVAGVAESYDIRRAVAAIAKAKEQADIVVVLVHWGEERVDRPVQHQFEFAKEYIDAGADLVIGSHPHVLQGFEQYKGKWIAYSLGNFIFSTNPKDAGAETGVLDASCTKEGACELQFYPMATVKAQPTPLEGEAAQLLLDRLTSISYGVKLQEDGKLVAD